MLLKFEIICMRTAQWLWNDIVFSETPGRSQMTLNSLNTLYIKLAVSKAIPQNAYLVIT